MEALAPEVAAEYARRAEAVRERQASMFTKTWNLQGAKAIVQAGSNVVVRLLPRWDFSQSLIKGPDGKSMPNPAYKPRVAYQRAFEHWYSTTDGRPRMEYCPKSLDPMVAAGEKGDVILATSKIRCSICLAAMVLKSGNKEEKDSGKKISAREVFIFNAVVGSPRLLGDDKLVDIRPLACAGTIYGDISDIMTGGTAGAKFARGNIMSPAEGFDLAFKRPKANTGDSWSVACPSEPTPIAEKEQYGAFKGWVTRMTNLEEMVKKETKTEEGIFEAYYGRKPEAGELDKLFAPVTLVKSAPRDVRPAAQPNFAAPTADATGAPTEPEGSNDEPDDFMGLMPPSGKAPRR